MTRFSIVDVPNNATCGAFHVIYQAKILIEVSAELLHLYIYDHLGISLLLPVWELGGKVLFLMADKIVDL